VYRPFRSSTISRKKQGQSKKGTKNLFKKKENKILQKRSRKSATSEKSRATGHPPPSHLASFSRLSRPCRQIRPSHFHFHFHYHHHSPLSPITPLPHSHDILCDWNSPFTPHRMAFSLALSPSFFVIREHGPLLPLVGPTAPLHAATTCISTQDPPGSNQPLTALTISNL
jgi:hypothetical protein